MIRLFLLGLLLFYSGFAATLTRLACGGSGGVDTQGNAWDADEYYAGGFSWNTANQPALAGLSVPYQSLRYSSGATPLKYTVLMEEYQCATAAQGCVLTMKFVEPNKTAAGQRIFSVSVNGQAVLTNLDLFASAGLLSPKDFTVPVTAVSGQVTITLQASVGNAVMSAIQIDGPVAPKPVLSLEGPEATKPAACPGPGLVFWSDPAVQHLWWCTPATPWTRNDGSAVAGSVVQCAGAGVSADGQWNCSGLYGVQLRKPDGSLWQLVGVAMALPTGNGLTWTAVP